MKSIFFAAAAASMAIALSAIPSHAAGSKGFNAADLDNNGTVSESEFYRTQSYSLHQFFFRIDRDNDRQLTPEEFQRARRELSRQRYRSDE